MNSEMPRKSKKEQVDVVETKQASTDEVQSLPTLLSPASAPASTKKKQPKKNFVVVASVGPNGIQGNLMPEVRKPLIAHLQIQSKDVITLESTMHYDPNPPPVIQAFNPNELDSFVENPANYENPTNNSEETEDNKDAYKNTIIKPTSASGEKKQDNSISSQTGTSNSGSTSNSSFDFYRKEQTLLVQFKNSEETKQIPEKTDLACFWCCHTFENRPCVIPSRDLGTHLQVYGNFCCPECAMAYLFDQRMDAHSRWEQLSLLNRVYSEMVGGCVFVAPSRTVLRIFGGPYSIEQFRSFIRSHKYRVDIHLPPMVSILSTMDTKPIDFYDASVTKTILETAQERVARAEEVLRLKRTKPLKAWESTLDACMNIRVGTVKN